MASNAQLKKLDALTREQQLGLTADLDGIDLESMDPMGLEPGKVQLLMERLEEVGAAMGASDPLVKREGLKYLLATVLPRIQAELTDQERVERAELEAAAGVSLPLENTELDNETTMINAKPNEGAAGAVVTGDPLSLSSAPDFPIPPDMMDDVAAVSLDPAMLENLNEATAAALQFCEVKFLKASAVAWLCGRFIDVAEEKGVDLEELVRSIAVSGGVMPDSSIRTLVV